jgi:hypothetical protein
MCEFGEKKEETQAWFNTQGLFFRHQDSKNLETFGTGTVAYKLANIIVRRTIEEISGD